MSSQQRRAILPQTSTPAVQSTLTSTARTRIALATRVSTQASVTTSKGTRTRSGLSGAVTTRVTQAMCPVPMRSSTSTRARSTLSAAVTTRATQAINPVPVRTSTSTRAHPTLSGTASTRVTQTTSDPVVTTGVARATRGSIRANRTSPYQVASRNRTPTTEGASVRSAFAATQEDAKAGRPIRLCEDVCNCQSPKTKPDINQILKDSRAMVNVYYCPICYTNVIEEALKLKLTKCGHVFCEQCITESLSSKSTCPICLANVTKGKLMNLFL